MTGHRWQPRFTTNPDIPGTEKLAVSSIRRELLSMDPPLVGEIGCAGDLPPMSTFLVKGWSRSVAAVVCLLHAWQEPEALEADSFQV